MSDETDVTPPENLVDLINKLVEPPEPAPVSMVPQTAGWWVLLALVFLAAAYVGYRYLKHYRANAYRRAAMAELASLQDDGAGIAALIRRTALAVWPRDEVAGLTGESWIEFLTRTGDFPADVGPALLAAPYVSNADGTDHLSAAAAKWIQSHKREAAS